jgi:hypothetical protein
VRSVRSRRCEGAEKERVCARRAHLRGGMRSRAWHPLLSSHAAPADLPLLRAAFTSPHDLPRTHALHTIPFMSPFPSTGVGEDGSKALPHAIAAASVLAGWLRDCPSAVSALLEVPDAMQGIIAAVAHG